MIAASCLRHLIIVRAIRYANFVGDKDIIEAVFYGILSLYYHGRNTNPLH
jgi:hypothetical protein